MGVSIIQTQRELLLETIRNTTRGEWKVLVVDEQSKKLLDNIVKEDDILNENITNIELIEAKRQTQDMDAVYLLSPLPHIVDCIMADFERRRYRRSFLLWTSVLSPALRTRIDRSNMAREQIAMLKVINMDYYPRESHVATFRDPWSFPVLFHPACSNLVRHHIADLAKRIVATCVSLGEYPTIRYYSPRNPLPTHEAHILSSIIAGAVQDELDTYKQWNADFPPPSNRPPGALYVVDRSMDVYAPFLHEFTYQAMAHDLLPLKDGDKVSYKTVINAGQPDQEEKDMEIGEKDKLWVEYRHRHMKDTIDQLMSDFQRFLKENPHFANANSDTTNINVIKTMLAGLPQFQEMKEAYSLHLNMAQEAMDIFQKQKLADLASLEQTIATGLDEEYKKPKNVADQTIRMLDEEAITSADRLRLIALYLLFKDGLLPTDIRLLLNHAGLLPQDQEVLQNMELLGARVFKQLKDQKPAPAPLFPQKPPPPGSEEESFLSRFEPNLKLMLQAHVAGTLDPVTFPYTKPELSHQPIDPNANISAASLRSAKPTWAKSKLTSIEPRQRVIVFMAGGATYSESRACYEISAQTSRDVVLLTSHMLSPGLWMRQLGDLGVERRRLGIPADLPPKKAPTHLFEDDRPKPPPIAKSPQPLADNGPKPPQLPVKQMQNLSMTGSNGSARPSSTSGNGPGLIKLGGSDGKEGKEGKLKKEKKHHFHFGSSKK